MYPVPAFAHGSQAIYMRTEREVRPVLDWAESLAFEFV
jgi:hypothetical protein